MRFEEKNRMERIIENFGSKRDENSANELRPLCSSFTFIDLKNNSKISA